MNNNWFIVKNWKRSSPKGSFPWKNDPWFIRIAPFFEISLRAIREKFWVKLFICFKFLVWKMIFLLLNYLFNDNIAIFESKIIYFFMSLIFCKCTTLKKVKRRALLSFVMFHEFSERCFLNLNNYLTLTN